MRVNMCLYCGTPSPGSPVCQHCTQRAATAKTNQSLQAQTLDELKNETQPHVMHNLEFTHDSMLVIQVNTGKSAYVVVRLQSSATVGRSDESQTTAPTIDFTPHQGLEFGVSRVHARIDRCENMVTLTDLGSRNGTYIYQQWCRPHSDYLVRDNDEIMFGRLKTRVHFRSEAAIRRAAALTKR